MSKALIPLGLIGAAGVMGSLASGQGNKVSRGAEFRAQVKALTGQSYRSLPIPLVVVMSDPVVLSSGTVEIRQARSGSYYRVLDRAARGRRASGPVLIDSATGKRLKVGDTVTTFRGEKLVLTDMTPPHKRGSTGRVYVKKAGAARGREYFPGVINAEWKNAAGSRAARGRRAALPGRKYKMVGSVEIRHNRDWDEYIVIPANARNNPEAWYHTGDRQDAVNTANSIENRNFLSTMMDRFGPGGRD